MTNQDTCYCCGKPTDKTETHHHNHRRDDNHPNNLTDRDRRCHMNHHNNQDAAKFPYGPES